MYTPRESPRNQTPGTSGLQCPSEVTRGTGLADLHENVVASFPGLHVGDRYPHPHVVSHPIAPEESL